MRVEVHDDVKDVPDLKQCWEKASQTSLFHCGGYFDYADLAAKPGVKLRIVVLRPEHGEPVVAPFFLSKEKKSFTIGERRLFTFDVATQTLYSQWMMQSADEAQLKEVFRALVSYSDYDWMDLGEIPVGSPLHRTLGQLGWRWIVSQRGRRLSMRWLIELPTDFDGYLKTLNSKSRQSTKRKMRKLEKKYDVDLKIVNEAADVDLFLTEGEKISRKTYLWNVGQKLINDEETRARYTTLCSRGQLRCYLLSLDGKPSAFLRGTIEDGLYHYETPGFDPEYRKDSLGIVLLMYAVRDIIENTECRIFDFGVGGDDTGYKSSYGTKSIDCAYLELGRRSSVHANVIADVQFLLNKTKNAANAVLGRSELRQKIKRAIRQTGDNAR